MIGDRKLRQDNLLLESREIRAIKAGLWAGLLVVAWLAIFN